nr:DUF3263 domain-containing protein [Rhodococcus sp. 15-649-1-2]
MGAVRIVGAAGEASDRRRTRLHRRRAGAPRMTDTEQAVLAFERKWWRAAGAKEAAIVDELGISAIRYYQVLTRLLDDREALAADPVLVKRLRRIRDSRRQGRAQQRGIA